MPRTYAPTGFDEASFQREFGLSLKKGIASLKDAAADTDRFLETHQKLVDALWEIVEKWDAPKSVVERCEQIAKTQIEHVISEHQVDIVRLLEPDIRRLCIALMKATGGYESRMPDLTRIVEDTLRHLEENGFSEKEAKRLLADLPRFETLDEREMVDAVSRKQDIRYAGFLRLVKEKGSPGLSERAGKALENMLSIQSRPPRMPEPARNAVVLQFRPLRQG